MSDLLNSASLVMIPSGYKEDIVYSQIPTDGSGDLSFTRASNGTRINSAGLVEVCPWNLVLYSEDLANGVWTTTSTTITADNTTAPNGTLTADKVEISSSTNARVQQIINSNSITGGLPCTFSVYIKSVSGTGNVGIRSGQTGLSSVFSYTNQWQRFEWTFNANALSEIMQFCNNTLVGGADSAPSFYAWGAQLNIGSTAKPYFPTTDRLNVPRLTYQNGGGGCPSLLLEKQSTNTFFYSEQFDNAYWVKEYVTISTNATNSPDGTQNAEKIQEDTSNASHVVGNNDVFAGGGQSVTFSIFLKASERSWAALRLYDGSSSKFAWYNLSTGVLGSVDSGVTASIENYGNGWFRCVMTITMSSVSITLPYVFVATGNNVKDYTGTSGYGLFVWGAQHEASSYPTSYIPTTSASATRVADACSKTGISSLIGQTEGVLFCDFEFVTGAIDNPIIIRDASYGTFIYINQQTSGNIWGQVQGVGNFNFSTPATNGRLKCAIAYKSGNSAFFVNGAQVGSTNTTTFTPVTMTIFEFLTPALIQVNQAVLFKTRLTNAELASLTTI